MSTFTEHIHTLRRAMRGHPSTELRATLKEQKRQKVWLLRQAQLADTLLAWEEVEKTELVITALREELVDRWAYWHAMHQPKRGFSLEERAHAHF